MSIHDIVSTYIDQININGHMVHSILVKNDYNVRTNKI